MIRPFEKFHYYNLSVFLFKPCGYLVDRFRRLCVLVSFFPALHTSLLLLLPYYLVFSKTLQFYVVIGFYFSFALFILGFRVKRGLVDFRSVWSIFGHGGCVRYWAMASIMGDI